MFNLQCERELVIEIQANNGKYKLNTGSWSNYMVLTIRALEHQHATNNGDCGWRSKNRQGASWSSENRAKELHCMLWKQHKLTFPKSRSMSKWALQLVHSDLAGPIETEPIGKAKYFLTFTDDFSRKVFIYFLKKKSDASETGHR